MADEHEKIEQASASEGTSPSDVANTDTPSDDVPSEPEAQGDAVPEAEAEPADDSQADAPEEPIAEADDAPSPAPEAAAPAAPAEVLTPKQRKTRARSAKAAKTAARSERSPEERHLERVAERKRIAAIRSAQRKRQREKERVQRTPHEDVAAREHEPGRQKTRQGIVISDRAEKSITVRVDTARRHRRYEKIVRTSRTLHAHDETNDAHIGDTVIVRECRPMSRTKRWRLVQVVERAK
jgi:small subunit ribosomal protein S17